MSPDEVFFRGIQVVVVVAMIADVTSSWFTGKGLGVHQPGCLFSVVILDGIIRCFVRPDPRPQAMSQALASFQSKGTVFTHFPADKVRETRGLVRGISDIEASSGVAFELAEQEALYLRRIPRSESASYRARVPERDLHAFLRFARRYC